MPELPEVESFRKHIEKTSLNQTIEVIELAAPKMLLNTTAGTLKKTLEGNALIGTHRHGKFLFIELKKNGHLLLHFGLTGDVVYVKQNQDESPSRFALRFHFKGGNDLYFTDTRKMGKIALVESVEEFIRKRGYGLDALKIKEQEFVQRIQPKRVAIKTVLMDQKILAGVGNEFSDEILYQTKVHPASPAAKLPKKKLSEIYHKMMSILKEAVKNNADREKLEHYFFLDNRKAGLKCPRCKGETAFQSIGGRSAYFCPSCQKEYRS